ncbi:hypothetical protein L1887_34247 [Cichorium endivia]|nr:hypothetical protein L1887_34247 [Cichorium endivia]
MEPATKVCWGAESMHNHYSTTQTHNHGGASRSTCSSEITEVLECVQDRSEVEDDIQYTFAEYLVYDVPHKALGVCVHMGDGNGDGKKVVLQINIVEEMEKLSITMLDIKRTKVFLTKQPYGHNPNMPYDGVRNSKEIQKAANANRVALDIIP